MGNLDAWKSTGQKGQQPNIFRVLNNEKRKKGGGKLWKWAQKHTSGILRTDQVRGCVGIKREKRAFKKGNLKGVVSWLPEKVSTWGSWVWWGERNAQSNYERRGGESWDRPSAAANVGGEGDTQGVRNKKEKNKPRLGLKKGKVWKVLRGLKEKRHGRESGGRGDQCKQTLSCYHRRKKMGTKVERREHVAFLRRKKKKEHRVG